MSAPKDSPPKGKKRNPPVSKVSEPVPSTAWLDPAFRQSGRQGSFPYPKLDAGHVEAVVRRARQEFTGKVPKRYQDLVAKHQARTLSQAEHKELSELSDQVESAWAEQLRAYKTILHREAVAEGSQGS
jgi:hypothetical protein